MSARVRVACAAALLFVLALLVRGLYLEDGVSQLYSTEQDGTRMARRYDDTALSILSGEGILFPKIIDPARTGLASRPPGYAMFLASVYAAFGRSFPIVAAVQDVLNSFVVLAVFLFGNRVFGFGCGFLAGILVAVSPHIAATSNLILADAISSVPILLAFMVALPILQSQASPRADFMRMGAVAFLLGCGVWLRPNVVLLGPFAGLFLFFLLGRSRRAFALASVMAIGPLLVVSPITLRNWLVFGEFVPVSINGGITLWQGVADAGGKEYGARVWDKQVMAEEAERYGRPDYLLWWAEPDGIARDRDRYRRATEVIKARPIWYARAMLRRMAQMLLFSEGPRELRSDGPPVEILQEDKVPLPSVPGLDARIDESAFARSAGVADFLREPLRRIQQFWLAVAILAWLGVLISIRETPKIAIFCLIVPLYYLVFESPFLYEWRVAVPMQYFLLPFAAKAVVELVRRLKPAQP
jgi:hypothetical protein